MVHDDWSGVLEIFPPDQHQQAVDGNCTYSYYVLSGKWTDPQGVSHPMAGVFQGRDPNVQSGDACAQSSHMLNFAIDFGNQEPAQQFYGYVFTHQNRRMAGFTWWHGLPFGWFATKR
jgi:hypothetical protein